MSQAQGFSLVDQPEEAPEIYGYLDYRTFLKDWFCYRKTEQSSFTAQEIAKKAGLTPAYFSMVLSGKRKLSNNSFDKLIPHLGLTRIEVAYLKNLINFADSDDNNDKLKALKCLRRFSAFSNKNPREFVVYQYFAHWYIPAIRELRNLSDFQSDAKWIQSKLRKKVELSEVRKALKFLNDNDLMATGKGTGFECVAPVFRVAMAQYHFEMLGLAASAIEDTSKQNRNILGHTFAISHEKIPEAKKILDKAMEEIRNLEVGTNKRDSVFQAELALFPLTGGGLK